MTVFLRVPLAAFVAAFLLLLISASPARAQGPGTGGPRPGATNAPIDGGVGLLVAAGAAYTLRRLRATPPQD
ncbi:hypothetical protein LGH70_16095 [Hymenobacter sp. BT635]|uniref:VPDSG-CTERM sorting domain-containing protein n=1 Tax=Hymenobacter nitidus TaxID=2880929 RepID=A0ABS8AFB9_9BACT|nr:hypothetical protein [Hymenobacter nitidus]MCB2379123.1 hypothetical protein [Hymenobacter nitidus]